MWKERDKAKKKKKRLYQDESPRMFPIAKETPIAGNDGTMIRLNTERTFNASRVPLEKGHQAI